MATRIPKNHASFQWQELTQALGIVGRGEERSVCGVSTDSRSLAPGEVFFALRGDRFDAHDFVEKLPEGFVAVVDQHYVDNLSADAIDGLASRLSLFVVPDTLIALGNLALFHRQRWG
ncbi:MAG: Mur ligase domain-containing protein, partial [Polyangiaceae bacterium]|nr:Mur ligase domain-containing protein [Polyangiaceae bacterium]